MPTIPKFAVSLAKLAKSNPKIIPSSPTSKNGINVQPKKFAKDDIELAKIRKEKIKKSINQSLSKKAKDNLYEPINLLKIKSDIKLSGWETGEKVAIYNSDNTRQFVEIIWPNNPIIKNVLSLVRKQIKNGIIQKIREMN